MIEGRPTGIRGLITPKYPSKRALKVFGALCISTALLWLIVSPIYSHWCSSDGICVSLGGLPNHAPAPFVEYGDAVNVAEVFGGHTKLEDFITPYQHIKVYDNYELGKILVLDDDLQITESDEENYHEMMTHVPLVYMASKPQIDVLIIGGGDGGLARQCLRWANVNSITMVEIDDKVIEVVKKHFSSLSPVFNNEKLHVVHSGGAEWTAERVSMLTGKDSDESLKFDLILVDSTDYNSAVQIMGVAKTLFSTQFYTTARALLRVDGALVCNADSPSWNLEVVQMVTLNMKEAGFSNVCPFQSFQPSFLSGHYAYVMASASLHPWKSPIDWHAYVRQHMRLHYYTPDVHYASFVLPRFFARTMEQCAGPLKDAKSLPSAEHLVDRE